MKIPAFKFRNYDSNIGRFLSAESPCACHGIDPLAADYTAWSPYSYVLGNPIKFVDPDGRSAEDIIVRGKNSQGDYETNLIIKSKIVHETIDLDFPSLLVHEPLSNCTVQDPLIIDKVNGISFDDILTASGSIPDAWAIEFSGDVAVAIGTGVSISVAGFLSGPDKGGIFAYWGGNLLAGGEGGTNLSVKTYSSLIPESQFSRKTLSGNEFGLQISILGASASAFVGYEGSLGLSNHKPVYRGNSVGFSTGGHPTFDKFSGAGYWTQSELIGQLY